MKQIGRIIYSYRKVNGLSQDELADIVGVSPAAVSKWERNLSFPDVEMLCRLADYFRVTVDDLLGRNQETQAGLKFDNQADEERFILAAELMECCGIARNEGLFAVEEHIRKKKGSVYDFLKFAFGYFMDLFLQQTTPAEVRPFLLRYAESEKDKKTAEMVAECILLIASGENEQMVREVLRSFLGRRYAWALAAGKDTEEKEKRKNMGREDMIHYYSELSSGIPDTGLLEELEQTKDEDIQKMLRKISDIDFVRAAAGASPKVRVCLFRNLSDRLLRVLGEDLVNFSEGPEEVKEAQRFILEKLGE